ncbi:hypothetical protein DPMN_176400 [Dreissena polymorpha]|uniref:Uncharacterized protein n=1 Tax=Dreissena polymorpha TaxID=45954 RepID=A0A9D4EAX2_DREPO|nr:hypothetical protein DPMN_176400 [Dreissena polymorpha]
MGRKFSQICLNGFNADAGPHVSKPLSYVSYKMELDCSKASNANLKSYTVTKSDSASLARVWLPH